MDYDKVEEVNLNRDGFSVEYLGWSKVDALKDELQRNFSKAHKVNVETIEENVLSIEFDTLTQIAAKSDIIIIGADSTNACLYINTVCVLLGKTFVDAGYTTDGLRCYMKIITPKETPCLACSHTQMPAAMYTTLKDQIVPKEQTGYYISFAPVLTFLASLVAMTVSNILFNISTPEFNYLSANLVDMSFYSTKLKRREDCPVCGDVNEK